MAPRHGHCGGRCVLLENPGAAVRRRRTSLDAHAGLRNTGINQPICTWKLSRGPGPDRPRREPRGAVGGAPRRQQRPARRLGGCEPGDESVARVATVVLLWRGTAPSRCSEANRRGFTSTQPSQAPRVRVPRNDRAIDAGGGPVRARQSPRRQRLFGDRSACLRITANHYRHSVVSRAHRRWGGGSVWPCGDSRLCARHWCRRVSTPRPARRYAHTSTGSSRSIRSAGSSPPCMPMPTSATGIMNYPVCPR